MLHDGLILHIHYVNAAQVLHLAAGLETSAVLREMSRPDSENRHTMAKRLMSEVDIEGLVCDQVYYNNYL